jgi:hypothetical protein
VSVVPVAQPGSEFRVQPDFRVLFESAPGLSPVLAPDLRSVAASQTYRSATKSARAEVIGRGLFALVPDNPDNGPGVPRAVREAVFERFFRIGETNTRRFGAGLELAIARDFVDPHDGSIGVGDAGEGGASFTVELPLVAPPGVIVSEAPAVVATDVAPDALSLDARGSADELAGAAVSVSTALFVLVVEDNADMGRLLCDILVSSEPGRGATFTLTLPAMGHA